MSTRPSKNAALTSRIALVATVAAVALGSAAASALAVINGSPDNGRHPYVGTAVWFPTGNEADGFELCSGSLVSPTVFVTAAHCFPEGAHVLVDLEEDALGDLHRTGFGSAVPGTAHPDPDWSSGTQGLAHLDRNDLAVVVLDGAGLPQLAGRYATLPRLGYDDSLPNNQQVEIVGYGLQSTKSQAFGTRVVASAKVVPGGGATSDGFLKLSSSPGFGGATCNGDSGGPDLQAGTDVVLAISSYGATTSCNAVEYSQRMDTAGALGFVSSFLR
jgi:hypothetical protein